MKTLHLPNEPTTEVGRSLLTKYDNAPPNGKRLLFVGSLRSIEKDARARWWHRLERAGAVVIIIGLALVVIGLAWMAAT